MEWCYSMWTLLVQFCPFSWPLTPESDQKQRQLGIVDLGFPVSWEEKPETREKEGGSKPHGPALGLCLDSNLCLFRAQEVNRAFISLSGLGQDTTTEKTVAWIPDYLTVKGFFINIIPPGKGDFCDIRQPKCLPARPFALGEHAGSERSVSSSTSGGVSERAEQAWS